MTGRITQNVLEALLSGTPNLRVSKLSISVLRDSSPNLRVSKLSIGVLRNSSPNLRVSKLSIDVLRTTSFTTNQTITPSSIASAESWGTAKTKFTIYPSSINSSESWGNPTVLPTSLLSPSSIPSAESWGTPTTKFTIYPSSINSSESWGTPSLVRIISPSSINTAESWGTPQLNIKVYPNSINSAESWGTPKLNFTIYPSSINSAESWSTNDHIFYGDLISPSSINSSESWGTPQLNIKIYPNSINSAESWGTLKTKFTIYPSSINSAESWSTNDHIFYGDLISPSSINSSESWGTPTTKFTIYPSSINSAESWGTPTTKFTIYPSSINSAESWSTNDHIFFGSLLPGTIPSAESWGTPTTKFTIHPSSINSSETWPNDIRIFFGDVIVANSILTAESWSTNDQLNFIIHPNQINSSESWGTPTTKFTIYPNSINSGEHWSNNDAISFPNITVTSIPTAESWGNPKVNFIVRLNSINSTETFGTAKTKFTIYPSSINSSETWPNDIRIFFGEVFIPSSILSTEHWGTIQFNPIHPSSILSAEHWGIPSFKVGPASIPSSEMWGTPKIANTIRVTRITTWNISQVVNRQHNTFWDILALLPRFNNVFVWYMGDRGTTLDDTNRVSSWSDRSSFGGDDATQASTFARPQLISNALNGLPVLRFNGTGTFLNITASHTVVAEPWTIIALVKDNRIDNNPRIILSNASSSSSLTGVDLGTVNTSPTRARMTDFFGGASDTNNPNGVGIVDIVNTDTNGYFVLIGQLDFIGHNPQIYEGDTFVAATLSNLFPNYNAIFSIGRKGGFATNYWIGDMAEIIIYNYYLPYSEIQSVVNYLKKKWFGTTPVHVSSSTTTWDVELPTIVTTGPISVTWNIFKLPTLVQNTLWNVFANPLITTSVTRIVRWNVRQLADTNTPQQTFWNVVHRPTTDITISTSWNDLHRPITDLTRNVVWRILQFVDVTSATTWNCLRLRVRNRSTFWNVSGFTGVTAVVIWNAKKIVNRQRSTTWNISKLATVKAFFRPTERSRWNVINDGDTLTTNLQQYSEWDVKHTIAVTITVIFNDDRMVAANNSIVFNDRHTIAVQRSTTWNVHILSDVVSRSTTWREFPNAKYGFPRWNVLIVVKKIISTFYRNSKDNNSGAYTTWQDLALIDKTISTTWHANRVAVKVFAAAIWNVEFATKISILTTWNVIRSKQLFRTTYWDVLSGIINCISPLASQHIDFSITSYWNIGQGSQTKTISTKWNVRTTIAPTPIIPLSVRHTDWRNLKIVSGLAANVSWYATLFSADVSITSLWLSRINTDFVRKTDWNIHRVMVGTLQRPTIWKVKIKVASSAISTTWKIGVGQKVSAKWNARNIDSKTSVVNWNVKQFANRQILTTWNVIIQTRRDTNWIVGAKANKQAIASWFVCVHSRKMATASFNTKVGMFFNSIGIWNVLHSIDKVNSTSWDYSVVVTGINTSWKDKQSISLSNVAIWSNFPDCGAEFVVADKRGGGDALLPKITVCELAKDRKTKGYLSRFDRTRRQR